MLRTHYSIEVSPKLNGKSVVIAGWVKEKRILGNLIFITLRDFKGTIQIIAKKNTTETELFKTLKEINKESVISIEGKVVENKEAPNKVEISPNSLKVLSEAHSVLPIDMSLQIETNLDKRLDARCLDLRREEKAAIFKIQSTLVKEIQNSLNKKGFMQVFTPCLMGVASESGSEVFTVKYYDRTAFLRQDPQLHRQLTIACGFEKIYDIGPSWRAEASHTTRHLTEHRVCAIETAFIENEYDVIKLEEQIIIASMKKLMKDCKNELDIFKIKLQMPNKFPVLEFPGVYDTLEKMEHKIEYGADIDTEAEKLLGEHVKSKYKSDFFFINKFPFSVKPFYVMRDGTWARSVDLVFNGVELSSGGQREHRYDKIMEQAKIKNMNPESIEWFANFFKYGVPPHGGFALGLERITTQLLNLQNVREAVLFPRDVERLVP